MRVLIGAPVCAREWCIRRWLEHAATSAEVAGVEYSFVLLGGIEDPTFAVVEQLPEYDVACVYVDEDRTFDRRDWRQSRFQRMTELRNRLLGFVRQNKQDYFLSLDTDVLLHPEAITNMIATQEEMGWDAVGGYCYLTQNRACPSYAHLPSPVFLNRPDLHRTIARCDVLMAIALMTEKAWSIDYEFNGKGEDIGHALAMRRARLRVGVDARVINKHLYQRDMLDRIDGRCGW